MNIAMNMDMDMDMDMEMEMEMEMDGDRTMDIYLDIDMYCSMNNMMKVKINKSLSKVHEYVLELQNMYH